jgi:hypothetical protein
MTISSGNLDSLMGMTLDPEALANLSYMSGSASGSIVTSLTGRTGTAPYAAANGLQVTQVNDSNNTIVVTATINTADPYGYGNGMSSTVPYLFTVVGTNGNQILLAAQGAAANNAIPTSQVASAIEGSTTGSLSGDLFAMSINGADLGSAVVLPQTLTFNALTPVTLTAAAAIADNSAGSLSAAVPITDSAANVASSLDGLQALAAAGKLSSITLTDSGTPTLNISAASLAADTSALGDIGGSYNITVFGASAANATGIAGQSHVSTVSVTDTGANIAANLDALQALVNSGKLSGATMTDSGFVNVSVTPTQLSNDHGLLAGINGNFNLMEDASSANLTMTGLSGHANTALFTGTATQYTLTPSGDGTSFTITDNGTGRSSVDHLSNFTALQFSNGTDFVAQTPGTTQITTGNVTELYGAVFGRLPDAPGLAFYQAELKANPNLSLFSLAQNFLASPEYQNNSAHNYAESASGDSQFITDAYNNLLHRAPETGAIPFYQAIVAQYTNGLTAGTAAYAAAQAQGHAVVLTDFSQSAEFLNDVQITATNPASAQHWLYLI